MLGQSQFALRARDECISPDVESKEPTRPVFGVIDANSRSPHNLVHGNNRRCGDEEDVAKKVKPVELFVDSHGAAQQSRALRSTLNIFLGLEGPEKHCGGRPFRLGDDIHAEIHPVDHVDVSMSGRAEHRLRAARPTFGGMGRQIMGTQIRFVLDDPTNSGHAIDNMNEELSEQIDRNLVGRSVIERSRQSRIDQGTWQRH